MERNANYALVGVVSLALFVALVAFVVWLAGFSFNRKFDIYDIVFIGPVRGLSEGGEVHFNGIKVGEVSDISLDAKDPNRVIARARLKEGVPVRVDSFATLEPQGITGVNYVQITAGTTAKSLLKDVTPRDVIPVINSQKSALSDLLEGGGTVLQRTVQALDQVNKLLSNENVRSITASMHNVEGLTADLKQRMKLLDQADQTLKDVDAATLSFKKLADSSTNLVNGEGRQTLTKLSATADELQQTARSAHAMVQSLQGPTNDFATNGLPQLTASITTLQKSADNLNALVAEARQSPRSLISKTPSKEVEVKP